ncbi:flagellar biosynthesis regulator FlaF [Lichenicoccus sp.]|uniref:flagellar biosynthesis regulator FlaF n=1 Tax=Lichenicoccus sp. TaxID=2781899 RepID=UPI003D12C927
MANPYAHASAPTPPREEQAMAFRLVNRKLRQADSPATRNAALGLNHELWSILFRDLGSADNRLPPVLRQDCTTLARWSMAYSTRALLKDLPLEPLVAINEDMAQGLS